MLTASWLAYNAEWLSDGRAAVEMQSLYVQRNCGMYAPDQAGLFVTLKLLCRLQMGLSAVIESGEQMAGLQGRAKELMSHPVPSSPSTWDEASVMSSPAVSVRSPVARSASSYTAGSSLLA